MARTIDIVAVVTPILIVVAVAVSTLRVPEKKKPPPDLTLVVCSYDTPDDRTLTYVVEGRDCAACRRHTVFGKLGHSPDVELTGCYRQVQRGVDPETFVPADEAEPRWTEAESEAASCDVAPRRSSVETCSELKEHLYACRRQCHRDPDCSAMCRSRCDARPECRRATPPRREDRPRIREAARVDSRG